LSPTAPTQAPLVLDNTMENILIRVNPHDSNEIQVLVEDTVVATYANNSASAIVVVGSRNNNSVTVDETWGVVNTPITYDGGGEVGAPGDRMIVLGSNGDDVLNLTPTTANSADISFNGSALYSFANIRKFSFNGGAGNDEMTVDSTASVLNIAGGVAYDVGSGFDRLNLAQTGGAAATSDSVAIGATHGSGRSSITAAGGT